MTRNTTKKLTLVAIFSAISFALTIFPQIAIIPSASFLKIDFSIVPAFLAFSWLGFGSAVWVLVIRTLLKLILFNEGANTYIGTPVNLVIALTFLLVLAAMAKVEVRWPKWLWQSISAVVASVSMTVVAYLANIVWAIPLYASFANFDIAKFIGVKVYLWGMVVPFNLLEGLIWFIVSVMVVAILAPFKKSFRS
ncbi:ECF transporter S component [Fructobacillus evanidus]|uniref:Riboflavin transporter n=1 Tax=Fructobacillus evanidus TaxID=3064281 RepID=A0ABM9MVQ2_9LACO|nr:Riboflavin transporter FmnP (FmnP) [Fructobacillus sp. LMG 32999]CAK1230673.1 Riboflavin transporter FmnP (FmnP) [Fructobacillus sp. LMG 32999]CAK1233438.1 Riboflavin transporter FmnP (FmnP) [Fructobacillus sp. LMG 32999]CAK1233627.1 Riboflavin transporter FmnP (FmnP) [Fructobacillus sp. LMG 32999]CAK1234722.1 Riboflavin transporter FmnP (FmnP) [Fructobacillus sp. LMG 32999]